MDALLEFFGDWTWWIIGAVLLISELLATTIFLVWLGLAALSVGVIDLVLSLDWQMEMLLFVILSVIYVIVGRRYMKTRAASETDQPYLNQRMQAYVGRTVTLHEAIVGGEGKVRIDDAVWRVIGRDAPAGAKVRITGVRGKALECEPV